MTNQLFVKMVLDAWYSKVKDADTLFDKLSDEQLQKEVAPNRNRGIYLLGHLVAVHDNMRVLLGLGDKLYPQLLDAFVTQPDDKTKQFNESAAELRKYWKNINSVLDTHFKNTSADEWFQKHTSVSAEDFKKEPHRNKLNVLISRTNHLTNHTGQLVFLKS